MSAIKNSAGAYCALRGTSVSEVARRVNKPRRTVLNWYASNRPLFVIVVAGVCEIKKQRREESTL